MILEAILELARHVLAEETECLVQKPDPVPPAKIFVFGPDGVSMILVMDLVDEAAKNRLAAFVRAQIKEHNAFAVASFHDTFTTHVDKEHLAAVQRLGVVAASNLGLCRRREALILTVETPMGTTLLVQMYKRSNGKIVLEERKEEETQTEGRFGTFFKRTRKETVQ